MTGDEMARKQHDADALLEDLAEDLELDGEAGDGVRGGASAPSDALSKASLLTKVSTDQPPAVSKSASSPADLLGSSLDKSTI